MKPQQALNILIEATAALNANRQAHQQIEQALRTLQDAINPPNPKGKGE